MYHGHYFRAHISQMKVLLLAGYETTSSELIYCLLLVLANFSSTVSLTVSLLWDNVCAHYSCDDQWTLIELSRHPDIQTRLREELLAFGGEPTYDQLKANLPYLDAVVHENLRLHPPLGEFTRLVSIHVCM